MREKRQLTELTKSTRLANMTLDGTKRLAVKELIGRTKGKRR